MKSYFALIAIDLRLALRQKSVIFFNYLFPLIFLVIFAQFLHGDRGGMTQILTLVIIIGVLSNGLFGAGIRAVAEREANILRRYKVTPITSTHLLVASVVTGWAIFMPFVVLIYGLAHFAYGMPWPARMGSILVFLSLGILAFRAIGMILAAVANSMQESQILVQLIYLPMLLLSGATFPSALFPPWLLIVVQFLPATYLVSGLQGMALRQESLGANALACVALILTTVLGLLIASKLFRWEKDEKIKASGKLWIAGVLLPFVLLGIWQAHSGQNVDKTRILERQLARSGTYLVRGARIFTGDGKGIDSGAVLVREGKIAEVYEGIGPDPEALKATTIEAAGKTLLPGLIDVSILLSAPGGFPPDASQYQLEPAMERHLAAYLYSGVTAVRSMDDPLDSVLKVRTQVNSGLMLGAELSACGPVFAAKGSREMDEYKDLPDNVRQQVEEQLVRTPESPYEARREVGELKNAGVDCIEVDLDSAAGGTRLDSSILQAIVQEAHAQQLPVSVETGDVRDVADALATGADVIEQGSFHEAIPDALLEQMARQGTFYDPALSEEEALIDLAKGNTDLLKRSLVQQVGPADLLEETERRLASPQTDALRREVAQSTPSLAIARLNLLHAYQHGVKLVTGSGAGNLLIVHGPTMQHEVELWSAAGIPASTALQAATRNGALLLRDSSHIGTIHPGGDADMLLVDGNPLEDVSAIERISTVFFKGERLDRSALFAQDFDGK